MKKSILGLLSALLLLSITISGAMAKDFKDLQPNYWAFKQIQALANDNIVVGYPDSTFKADVPVTRAEFAVMVVKSLHQENAILNEVFYFSDIPTDFWAYRYIQRAQAFNLLKGFPDGTFKPYETVTKAEAITIISSAIDAGDVTQAQAKDIMSKYDDAVKIPSWALIAAAKSEKFKMTANSPVSGKSFEPDKKISRAEVVANIYNMKQEALLHPNSKLAEAMNPKIADGRVLDGVIVDGILATISQGTFIPVNVVTPLNSQTTETGTVFAVKVAQNLISKDKYLLIPVNSAISGEVTEVQPGRYFIRNAKMTLNTKYIDTPLGQKADFCGNIDTQCHCGKSLFARIINYIFKGRKIKLNAGKEVFVKLDKPIVIDLSSTRIVK